MGRFKLYDLAEEELDKRDELHLLLKEWCEKASAPIPERKSG